MFLNFLFVYEQTIGLSCKLRAPGWQKVALFQENGFTRSFYLKPACVYFFRENRLTHSLILWQFGVFHEERTCPFEADLLSRLFQGSLQCYFHEILPFNEYI
jgi:hypothetical protein